MSISTFSSTEIKTGEKWNGRDVYARLFGGTLGSATSSGSLYFAESNISDTGIDRIVSTQGWIEVAGDVTSASASTFTSSTNLEGGIGISVKNGTLKIRAYSWKGSYVANSPFEIGVKYTKA